jgi:uncharacterized protein (DUF1499 family)
MQEENKDQVPDQPESPPVETVQETTVNEETNPAPVQTVAADKNWGGKFVLFLGAGSCFAALLGAVGSGIGLWEFRFGFLLLMIAFGMAILSLLIGFGIGWWRKRKGRPLARPLRWTGMALGGALALWLLSFAYTARSVPAIHDISTDLADPPQFTSLALRTDYLDQIPGADDPEMRGMNPLQRWAAIHAEAYGDIRSVRIAMPVADAVAKAERLAKVRGWDIAVADPIEGRLEATDTSRFFRFKDDVVIRVRPTQDNSGSIVDMRSISRVGVSDLGVNAKRVRSFLADMAGTNPAG